MKCPVTTIQFSVISPSGYHQIEKRRLTHPVSDVVLKLGWILQLFSALQQSHNSSRGWPVEVTPGSSSSSRTRQQVIPGLRSSLGSPGILDVSTVREGKTLTRRRKLATPTFEARSFGFFVNITTLQRTQSSFSVVIFSGHPTPSSAMNLLTATTTFFSKAILGAIELQRISPSTKLGSCLSYYNIS